MKKLLLLTTAFILAQFSNAQSFLGLRSSNWGGITNVNYSPAIADSRYIADINLIGLGVGFNNNYVGVTRNALFKFDEYDDKFQDKYLHERLNGKQKNVYLGMQMQGPLSFLFSFGNKNENAIAFSYHFNTILNVDGLDETLARIMYYGVGTRAQPFFFKQFNDDHVAIKNMTWMDYGLTYSRVVYDKNEHMLKAGATLKLLQGLLSVYMYADNLKYRWNTSDTLDLFQTEVSYGHSDNVYFTDDYTPRFKFNSSKPSVGADLGLVYEWRPKKDKFKYEMNGRTDLYRRDKDLYTLQVGFSAIDIGRLKFSKGQFANNFTADIRDWYVKGFVVADGIQSIDDTIKARFVINQSDPTYKMWLPTRFNIWLDYQTGVGFGINLSAQVSQNLAKNRNQVHNVSVFALTPHYDHAWFGAYLPVSYDVFGNVNLGLTLRLGPLTIGTGDFLGFVGKKFVYNYDIHAALKLPIPYMKERDRDKDFVSNRKDDCKKDKGTWPCRGCPDRDNDSIPDLEDDCPDVPGPRALKGCPDTDGDGILDKNDSCVFDKGLAEFHGCPDRDSDGVMDKLDECPDTPGKVWFQGCPDRDNDSVPDRDDLCVDVPGDINHKGCPDTDKDGLYDHEDRCIQVPGPKENFGCPWPDADGDGVFDKDDDCPKVFGVASNRGCPVLEKKEIETVKYAFENLEFETGKAIIRTHSYPSLNALAALLVKKPNYGLKIEGHTDSVGTDEKNMILSQNRANAVKTYLVKKGVDGAKLEAYGYGETRPVQSNSTAAGRQKNRRVEMTITFK